MRSAPERSTRVVMPGYLASNVFAIFSATGKSTEVYQAILPSLRAASISAGVIELASGRAGVTVAVEAAPQLLCQRCLEGFKLAVAGRSEIEFSIGPDAAGFAAADSQREIYEMDEGRVSLRELAEEELLLALPIVPMHAPQNCGRIPTYAAVDEGQDIRGEQTRPFAALQNVLKKT